MQRKLKQYLAAARAQRARVLASLSALALGSLASPTFAAGLPTAVTTATGTASGDYIAIMQQYFKMGFLVVGLAVAAYGLITVGAGGIEKFQDYQSGRATVKDLTVFYGIGVVSLVVLVYLLTQASTVL